MVFKNFMGRLKQILQLCLGLVSAVALGATLLSCREKSRDNISRKINAESVFSLTHWPKGSRIESVKFGTADAETLMILTCAAPGTKEEVDNWLGQHLSANSARRGSLSYMVHQPTARRSVRIQGRTTGGTIQLEIEIASRPSAHGLWLRSNGTGTLDGKDSASPGPQISHACGVEHGQYGNSSDCQCNDICACCMFEVLMGRSGNYCVDAMKRYIGLSNAC